MAMNSWPSNPANVNEARDPKTMAAAMKHHDTRLALPSRFELDDTKSPSKVTKM